MVKIVLPRPPPPPPPWSALPPPPTTMAMAILRGLTTASKVCWPPPGRGHRSMPPDRLLASKRVVHIGPPRATPGLSAMGRRRRCYCHCCPRFGWPPPRHFHSPPPMATAQRSACRWIGAGWTVQFGRQATWRRRWWRWWRRSLVSSPAGPPMLPPSCLGPRSPWLTRRLSLSLPLCVSLAPSRCAMCVSLSLALRGNRRVSSPTAAVSPVPQLPPQVRPALTSLEARAVK